MLNMSVAPYAVKANNVTFASQGKPDIGSIAGKEAILTDALELECQGKPEKAENLYKSVFERDIGEFDSDRGAQALYDSGLGLSRVLEKQGFNEQGIAQNKEKALEAGLVLHRLAAKLVKMGNNKADQLIHKAVYPGPTERLERKYKINNMTHEYLQQREKNLQGTRGKWRPTHEQKGIYDVSALLPYTAEKSRK